MSEPVDGGRELDRILDDVSFQLTAARTAGLKRTNETRAALKRAGSLIADADVLVSSVGAERRKRTEDEA